MFLLEKDSLKHVNSLWKIYPYTYSLHCLSFLVPGDAGEIPINLQSMSVDCERKPEYTEKVRQPLCHHCTNH